jgi:MFS family permease
LLPNFITEEHAVFSPLSVGVLLATYQIGFLLTAPFVAETLPKLGRKNVVIYSLFTMSLSTIIFACAGYIKNDGWFYALSLSARLV